MLETERLYLRWFDEGDAAFILRLLNEPSWLRHIGDKGVRTLADAEGYIRQRIAAYQNGIGLFLVALKESGGPIGMCGLVRREGLDEVDIGFALLPDYWGQGYAYEAASAVLEWGRQHGLAHIVAIVSPDNDPSCRLLERLGFVFEEVVWLPDNPEALKLYRN